MKHILLIASLFLCAAYTTHAMEIVPIKNEPSYQTLQCIEGIKKQKAQQVKESLLLNADVNYINEDGKSLFYLACEANNRSIMEPFITHPDINLKALCLRDNTPLHMACSYGLSDTIDSMLNKNKNLTTLRNRLGNTPLMVASWYGQETCVNSLLSYYDKSTLNWQNYAGMAALHYACERKQYNIIKTLILHGALTTTQCNRQATPLMLLFSWTDEWNDFDSFLAEDDTIARQLIYATDANNNTQFHLCATTQSINDDKFNDYLKFLLKHCIDINFRNKDGKRAIDLAEEKYTQLSNFYATNKLPDIYKTVDNQEKIVRAFLHLISLQNPFKPLLRYADKEEPSEELHNMEIIQISSEPSAETLECIKAIKDRNREQLIANLNAGADVNHIDNDGKSLFHLACETGNRNIIMPIITHKDINIMALDLEQRRPLHIACEFNLTETVKSMLSKEPKLATLCNKHGNTPLMIASFCRHKNCVELLLEYNKNTIDWQNSTGNTALHCACAFLDYDIIKELISQGASTTIQNNSHTTPLGVLYNKNKNSFDSFLTPNKDIAHKLIHATDADSNTQFHLCATAQNIEAQFNNYLEFLISHGLNIDTINNAGKRAVDLAEQEYKRLYNFYKIDKLPDIYKVLVNQEQIMHAFLRHTPPHARYALPALAKILHQHSADGIQLPQELRRIIWHLYYALSIETIVANKYNIGRNYYDYCIEYKNKIKQQLIEKPEHQLLWSAQKTKNPPLELL